MERDGGSVCAMRGQRRRDRGGVIRDQEIARPQYFGKISKAVVLDGVITQMTDHQPHLVALESARFGRLVRFKARWQLEVQWTRLLGNDLQHVYIAAPIRNCASIRANGSRPSRSSTNAGATCSGSGRCERSTPGSAAWCMAVFISPGSTTMTRTPLPSSSAASTRERCSSAALLAP